MTRSDSLGHGLVIADVTGNGGAVEHALASTLSATGWHVACLGAPANLCTEEGVDAAFDRASNQLEPIGGLIVLADVCQDCASLTEGGPEAWEQGLLGHLRSSFLVLRRSIDEFIGA